MAWAQLTRDRKSNAVTRSCQMSCSLPHTSHPIRRRRGLMHARSSGKNDHPITGHSEPPRVKQYDLRIVSERRLTVLGLYARDKGTHRPRKQPADKVCEEQTSPLTQSFGPCTRRDAPSYMMKNFANPAQYTPWPTESVQYPCLTCLRGNIRNIEPLGNF